MAERVDMLPEPNGTVVGEWLAHNFGPERDVNEQALVLTEEVGELARALVKRSQGIRGTWSEWSREVRKEAADVYIALLAIAATEGFSLRDESALRWAEVSARDFRADPIGHGMPGGESRG